MMTEMRKIQIVVARTANKDTLALAISMNIWLFFSSILCDSIYHMLCAAIPASGQALGFSAVGRTSSKLSWSVYF